MVFRAWQVLFLACVLAGAGCKNKRDSVPKTLMVSSSEDATQPIVDEDGPVLTTADGVGWRVRDGVFESVVSGFRVAVPESWRLMVGAPLAQARPDAEVGIMHVNPDVYITLITERAPAPALRPQSIERMRARLGGKRGAPHTATFAGAELEMVRVSAELDQKLDYLHGIDIRDGRLIQVLAWFRSADRERAEEVLQAGLDAFQVMSSAEVAASSAELDKRRDTQSYVDPRSSLRSGVYRNFEKRWRWTKPQGSWRILAGDEARAVDETAELSLFEPAKNLYGAMYAERTTESGDRFHELAHQKYKGPRSKPRRRGEALITDVDMTVGEDRFTYRIATSVRDGIGIEMLFQGDPSDMATYSALVDAVIDGVEHDATLERVTQDRNEYRDHRLGFALRLPGPGFQFVDETVADLEETVTFVTWNNGSGALVGVVAVFLPQSVSDEASLIDLMERTIRDRVGAQAPGRATRSEATLAGVPAHRLQWPGLQAYVMKRDRVVYAWISTGNAGSPSDFRLLD